MMKNIEKMKIALMDDYEMQHNFKNTFLEIKRCFFVESFKS
jgi:hypothetical protein